MPPPRSTAATCKRCTLVTTTPTAPAPSNSADPVHHKVNLSHNPIPEIGWPAMTMEFPVKPSVDLNALKPGTRVNFTIEKGQGGMYEIQSMTPAGAGQ
jgi:Cu(I)/Ag(I) efflux system periplasmic protein CusF